MNRIQSDSITARPQHDRGDCRALIPILVDTHLHIGWAVARLTLMLPLVLLLVRRVVYL